MSPDRVCPKISLPLGLFVLWDVRPDLFVKYHCLFIFFKLSILYICSLDKCHISSFNALISKSTVHLFKPFPNKPLFSRVCCTSLLKTLVENEKLLITSNFSFSTSVYYPFGELSIIFIKLKIVVCKLSVWKSLEFVDWERVKGNGGTQGHHGPLVSLFVFKSFMDKSHLLNYIPVSSENTVISGLSRKKIVLLLLSGATSLNLRPTSWTDSRKSCVLIYIGIYIGRLCRFY